MNSWFGGLLMEEGGFDRVGRKENTWKTLLRKEGYY
jgi:hypothetical protein